MLGYRLDDDDPARTKKCFEAFRERHVRARTQLSDGAFSAVCSFLMAWEPGQAAEHPVLAEVGSGFGVFRLRTADEYVHERPAVVQYWNMQLAADSDHGHVVGVSLTSGETVPIARLHEPKIKGVMGGQSAGCVIVGFNDPAYESYGHQQSYNAPVGIRDAFRYTTALNRLLADEGRRVRIGDATVVFWTDRSEARDAEDVFAAFFAEEYPNEKTAESGKTLGRLRAFLAAAREGRLADELADPEAPFYVLGLSPNASRLNVRYWMAGTVAEFAQRLVRHLADLEMTGGRESDPPLAIRRLLLETAREAKDIPPQLAGDVARSVLGGLPYPQTLFASVVRRVRADGAMNHRRAAIMKACLLRNRNWEVPVALDRDHPDEAYHLGRLFAALEKTQEDATDGKLNATIKDRYFGAAAATPASVFPRLMRLHQFHIEKLPTDITEARQRRVRTKKFYETTVTEICGHVRRFPAHLSLEKQGLFQIAYYHQRQDFFTKKDSNSEVTTDE